MWKQLDVADIDVHNHQHSRGTGATVGKGIGNVNIAPAFASLPKLQSWRTGPADICSSCSRVCFVCISCCSDKIAV